MPKQSALLLLGVLLAATLFALGGWFQANHTLSRVRAVDAREELQSAAALLKDNAALLAQLPVPAGNDPKVMETFLDNLRHDGMTKSVDMKRRLDHISENFTVAAALLGAYAPQARTPGFADTVNSFRGFAAAWRERWNAVTEVFMAGGFLPAPTASFPQGLPAALQAELDAH